MSSTTPPPPPPPSPPPPPPSGGNDFGGTTGSPGGQSAPGGHSIPPAWKRIVARFLDGLIAAIAFGLIFASFIFDGDDEGGLAGFGADASFGDVYLYGLLTAAVAFVWDAVCTKQLGGSPMKLAFGMKVVQAGNGAPVEWRHAVVRWAVPGALALLPLASIGGIANALGGLINLVVFVVSLVFLFTKPLRQAVWDLAAKTIVVDR